MKPVKVLYLIDSLESGGTEKQLVQLLDSLNPDIVEAHLCTLKPSSGLFEDVAVPKFCLNFVSLLQPSVIKVLYRLIFYIRRHDIQVVQTFFQDPFALAAISRFFHRAKLVGSFRDLGFWRSRKESLKMRLATRFFDAFLANSEAVKAHFVEVDKLDPNKFTIIYNGFDTARGQSDEGRSLSLSGNPLVGIVANLNRPVKRVEDFITAAAKVYQSHPLARFIIIGDGHLRSQHQSLAAQLGIADTLTFAGSLPNPLDHIVRFSVGLITSETEGFSNAVVEYMACGVPVVATDVGGNKELVVNGENGFLVPVGDTDLMAKRILELLDFGLNQRIGLRNKHKILESFSMNAMVDRYSAFYIDQVK